MDGLTVGSQVLYVLESGKSKGQIRPAIVVRDWSDANIPGSDGMVNMQVFTDGLNDGLATVFASEQNKEITVKCVDLMVWRTSVHYSENEEPGTWHFPGWVE